MVLSAVPAFTVQSALRRQRGFTLVELVVVLVVMALLAVVAVPRFFDNQVFQERAYYDEVSTALRYARNLAIGSGCPVRVALAAGSYTLNQQAASAGHCDISDTSFSSPALLPDGQPASGIAPGGVALTPPTTFVFDAAGGTSLGSNQVIVINSRSLTVHAGSGYVSP